MHNPQRATLTCMTVDTVKGLHTIVCLSMHTHTHYPIQLLLDTLAYLLPHSHKHITHLYFSHSMLCMEERLTSSSAPTDEKNSPDGENATPITAL